MEVETCDLNSTDASVDLWATPLLPARDPDAPTKRQRAALATVRDVVGDATEQLEVMRRISVGLPVVVNERLPDAVLTAADEVELVDMSPRALRQRMKHGNVYPPERAAIALDKFFSEGNLTALRELALRFTARRVDEQLGVIATDVGGSAGGRFDLVAERTLVVIDGSQGTRLAIRRGASLAAALRGPLVGLVVETRAGAAASFDGSRDLRENLDYATDLGADVIRVEATDIASGVVEAVRMRRATRVVLAAAPGPRGLARLGRPSLLDELLERLPGIELHVVPAGERRER